MKNTLIDELIAHTDDLRKNGNLLAAEASMSYRAINYIRQLEAIIYNNIDPSNCEKRAARMVVEIAERLRS